MKRLVCKLKSLFRAGLDNDDNQGSSAQSPQRDIIPNLICEILPSLPDPVIMPMSGIQGFCSNTDLIALIDLVTEIIGQPPVCDKGIFRWEFCHASVNLETRQSQIWFELNY